ncbi:hypothetical protein ACFQZZ_32785 [Nocardia sp. GCM10030253]|uniref:hypothetical protein n=1 Tax=Nocardia sp. GCM10030253 TaxID=3273404 RepID=UPI00363EAAB9
MKVSTVGGREQANARSDEDEQGLGGSLAEFFALCECLNALVDVDLQDGLCMYAQRVIPNGGASREAFDKFSVPK